MSISIVVADDQDIVRAGLKTLLSRQPGMRVVAEAFEGNEAVQLATELSPDVILLDVNMPVLNGIIAAYRIQAECPGCKVLAMSDYADRRCVSEMLKAGAAGYVLKSCAASELVQAVRTVATKDQVYLSPEIAGIVVDGYVQQMSENGDSSTFILSTRELEVLQLLAEGRSTKQIAMHLNLSVTTIETHRKRIMDKLEIRSVAELTKYAIREGVTTLDP